MQHFLSWRRLLIVRSLVSERGERKQLASQCLLSGRRTYTLAGRPSGEAHAKARIHLHAGKQDKIHHRAGTARASSRQDRARVCIIIIWRVRINHAPKWGRGSMHSNTLLNIQSQLVCIKSLHFISATFNYRPKRLALSSFSAVVAAIASSDHSARSLHLLPQVATLQRYNLPSSVETSAPAMSETFTSAESSGGRLSDARDVQGPRKHEYLLAVRQARPKCCNGATLIDKTHTLIFARIHVQLRQARLSCGSQRVDAKCFLGAITCLVVNIQELASRRERL